ncbi:putative mitochondrial 54S ribosomal protein YmL38/YmL34 [Papiliotrema laurentii]|uniref:Large ribosomal subunit protein uL14m n=1 Tax=Papiliotrema laurentii TaxID=5418 RepID=A0AAD9L9W3_PAPLA|nr:putative mitochondrial 54S ribosomal protein YmL38/YmL34 [Papiliotrema laurentii]
MLGLKSVVNVIDNSGAMLAEVINVYKCKHKPKKSVGIASVGDEVKVVIKRARPISQPAPGQPASNVNKLRKGDMSRAVIVRTRHILPRADGRMIRFDDSACVLLNAKGEMMGTRIAGPVSALLRDAEGNQPGGRWAKILAMAPKVI